MSRNIVVLDYGLGNLRSVGNALRLVGATPQVSRDQAMIDSCDALVIPGVGAFPQAMRNLHEANLIAPLKAYIDTGRPLLGICLGMQILFDRGTEFESTAGLGLIRGTVDRIPIEAAEGRLPHIAWSNLATAAGSELFAGLAPEQQRFYFVHSFAASGVPEDCISATVEYCGHRIVAAVQRNNVYATQFHPEKSGPSGLQLLRNFVSRCEPAEKSHG